MATITSYTKTKIDSVEAASIVDGDIVGDDLILTRFDGVTINAGNVRGSQGVEGPAGGEVTSFVKADTSVEFKSGHQEGGSTFMRGTFTPTGPIVHIDAMVAARSTGWAGQHLNFRIGVLPAGTPPTPWEPGLLGSRISKLSGVVSEGLPGVTEWQQFYMPQLMPWGNTQSRWQHSISGLTAGRVYQWELWCGGQSYVKAVQFAPGSQPFDLSADPDGEHIWVGLRGTNKLALMTKGWTAGAIYAERTQEATVLAEIALPGKPTQVAAQPVGNYIAVLDMTNNQVVIVDSGTLAIVAAVPLPGGDLAIATRMRWQRSGSHLWVGSYNSPTDYARIHRFNPATLAFDQVVQLTQELVAAPLAIPLDMAPDDSYVLVYDSIPKRLVKINTTTFAETLLATLTNGADRGRVRAGGDVVLLQSGVDQIEHLSNVGVSLGIIGLTAQTINTSPSLAISPTTEQQLYFGNGNRVGWGWIDSHNKINEAPWWPSQTYVGEMIVTPDDGIITSLPQTLDQVNLWPGGQFNIRTPLQNPFGAHHVHVMFRKAEATRV